MQINLTVNLHDECRCPKKPVFDDVVGYELALQISPSCPRFEICDSFPYLDVNLCNVYRNSIYSEILNESGSNVCQYWKAKKDVRSCKASLHIDSISDEMRALFLLEDETQDAFEAEKQSGNYDLRLVFLCIE